MYFHLLVITQILPESSIRAVSRHLGITMLWCHNILPTNTEGFISFSKNRYLPGFWGSSWKSEKLVVKDTHSVQPNALLGCKASPRLLLSMAFYCLPLTKGLKLWTYTLLSNWNSFKSKSDPYPISEQNDFFEKK